MTEPPDIAPEFDLDVALSADLDGELDGYAAELGRPVDELRGELDTPAGLARRGELAAVRNALATPPGALDELTRRRLLAGASAAADPVPVRNGSPWIRGIAAAAVTLVLLAGVLAVTRSGTDGASTSSAARDGAVEVPQGDLGDLGSLDQSEIDRLINGNGTDSAARARAPAADADSESSAARSESSNSSIQSAVPGFEGNAGAQFAVAVDECAAAYASDESTIRFRAAGTYQGQPAVILGIDRDGRTIVFVVAAADCTRVLYSASR